MSVQDFRSRKHRSSARLAGMFAVGALAAVAIRLSGNWAYAPSLGWAAASLTYLVWVWSVIGRLSPQPLLPTLPVRTQAAPSPTSCS